MKQTTRLFALTLLIAHLLTPGFPARAADTTLEDLTERITGAALLARTAQLEAFGTRFVGSSQAPTVRDFLYQELTAMGWQTIVQEFPLAEPIGVQTVSWNVIARRPGTDPDGRVILSCHWDSINDDPDVGSRIDPECPAPGAQDNGSGTSIMLEVASVARDLPFRQDVEIVFFGSEELGIQGSQFYVDCFEQAGVNVLANFNFDSVGFDEYGIDDFLLFYIEANTWLKDQVWDWVQDHAEVAMLFYREPDNIYNCDAHPFWRAGYPGVTFWEGQEHAPYYHHFLDTIEGNRLADPTNRTFHQSMGRLALICLCKMAEWSEGAVGVDDVPFTVESGLEIYPNPFRLSTTISFSNAGSIYDAVEIFDIRGRRVRELPIGPAGVTWDGRDISGERMPSGVYLVRPKGAPRGQARRIILAK